MIGLPSAPSDLPLSAFRSQVDMGALNLSSIRYVTIHEAAHPMKHIRLLQDLFPDARIYSVFTYLTDC